MVRDSSAAQNRNPGLTDVPETMLWTLHSRANEAMRPDGVLDDPRAIEIYRSIDYDFRRSFGLPDAALALRASAFDAALRRFLQDHPASSIINLGEGLETQRYRVAAPECTWFSVDLPEAMAVRETYIPADALHRHLAYSASDPGWMAEIPRDRPVYLSAQGLLMYFDAQSVRTLLQALAREFPGAYMIFDTIPGWVARASRFGGGLPRTPHYKTPVMPWGASRPALRRRLRSWLGDSVRVRLGDYPPYPRGPAQLASKIVPFLPATRYLAPTIVELIFPQTDSDTPS